MRIASFAVPLDDELLTSVRFQPAIDQPTSILTSSRCG